MNIYFDIVNDLNKKINEYSASIPKFEYITDGKTHRIEILKSQLYSGESLDRSEILKEVKNNLNSTINGMQLMVDGLVIIKEIIK